MNIDALLDLIVVIKEEAANHKVTAPDTADIIRMYRAIDARIHPPAERITAARKIEISENLRDWAAQQQLGAVFTREEVLAATGGVNNRSESIFWGKQARAMPQIGYEGAKGPMLTIQQLNGPVNGHETNAPA